MNNPPIPMQLCFRCGKLTDETYSKYGVGCLSCYQKTVNSLTKEQWQKKLEYAKKALEVLNKGTKYGKILWIGSSEETFKEIIKAHKNEV